MPNDDTITSNTDHPLMYSRQRSMSRYFIVARYGLNVIGDQKPYFSVTASLWTNLAHFKRWPDSPHSGGQLHEEILRAWPSLADLVALHLSDIDGVPMHALANSRYQAQQENRGSAARLLRVDVGDLPASLDLDTWTAFVDAQRPRWSAEAAAAVSKYDLAP